MAFITMNPGYPGRAELPESLKALFRPVSMCVPDLQMICENMLMGEGFYMSKILARKFVILYKLCQDLLSAAPHYDWKPRHQDDAVRRRRHETRSAGSVRGQGAAPGAA